MTSLSKYLLSNPIYLKTLARHWQDFIRRCHELGFGELHDCQVKNGHISSVEKIVKKHTSFTHSPDFSSLTHKPLHESWISLLALCQSGNFRRIPLIKIETGQPVLTCTEERGWVFGEDS